MYGISSAGPLFLGGITVDFGGAYLAKSTLQNAADAAALAGGHEYLDSGRNVRSTKDSAKRSAQTNYSRTEDGHTAKLKEVRSSESFPDGAASIHIDTDAHDDYVDVRLRQKVQLPFFGMLGGLLNIDSLHFMNIQAASRAHLVTAGGTGPFDYTVFGAATSRWTKTMKGATPAAGSTIRPAAPTSRRTIRSGLPSSSKGIRIILTG